MLLDTSQLEVAKRSPKSSIENEQNGFGRVCLHWLREQPRERDRLAATVRQREVGSLLPRAGRAGGFRNVSRVKETKGGSAGENEAHQRENSTENFDAVTSWLSENPPQSHQYNKQPDR